MFARENKGNMMTENEILEKYNEVLMTHYNELVQIDNYGYFRFNENWLFHLLYGNDATMNAYQQKRSRLMNAAINVIPHGIIPSL